MKARWAVGAALGVASAIAALSAASCGSRTGLAPLPSEDGSTLLDGPEEDGAFVSPISVCPDAAVTFIYVIGILTTELQSPAKLYSFDPSTTTFHFIADLGCPGTGGPGGLSAFSMAVDRRAVAYVEYDDGSLFEVSTLTGACRRTRFRPFGRTYGMGFVASSAPLEGGVVEGGPGDGGVEERLYVALDNGAGACGGDGELATIDTSSFGTNLIGPFRPSVSCAELTGNGIGQLFAFSPTQSGPSFVYEIDPRSAAVLATYRLDGVRQGGGWAFGYWGGAFYTFTGIGPGQNGTYVNRFDPVSNTVSPVATFTEATIVGAGVSTCAPTM